MKKLIIALALFSACFSACASDVVINPNQLPQDAKTFVAKHFVDCTIALAEKDSNSYEVKLSNGWEIEFNKKGEWKDVDCKQAAVPASVLALVPASISQYVTKNYPGVSIVEISKGRGFEIELSNGIDLDFSKTGEFIKIDR